jgi:molybdopterin synthase sulfur carrier subunit
MNLANIAGKDAETVVMPDSVNTVTALLSWLRERGEQWNAEFNDERVQVTVNKNFAEPSTPIEPGDEVAIVPRAPA